MTEEKKRKCDKCGKEILEKDGVKLLRGITFACKECYESHKKETRDQEVCEFC